MKSAVFLLLCLSIFSGFETKVSELLKVTLPHGGGLIGRYLSSHSGRGIRAFMGVPYAEPPLGPLRFSNPVSKKPWEGFLKASGNADNCFQYDYLFKENKSIGSEDCLYLNVYVPHKPKSQDLLSVMVFFHGGGFKSGNGDRVSYGPDYLLDEDIILVTGNHRLGIFGFLSTNTLDSPGNYGLKDQSLMLNWVQENIAAFGGDRSSVTIFGQSTGGASVTYHTVSPLSRGLFHRGIAHSGTHFGLWAIQDATVAAENARKLAKALNCPSKKSNPEEMLECLRSKSAQEINSHFYDFFLWDIYPPIPLFPVVKPQHEGAFLDQEPSEISTGHDIPLMLGVTSNEGLMVSASILRSSEVIDDVKTKWSSILPPTLSYSFYSKDVQNEVTDMITDFYVQNYEKDMNDPIFFQKFTDVMSDGYITSSVDRFLQFHQENDQNALDSKTYLYLFNHKGDSSFAELRQRDINADYGVCHSDDLIPLFPVLKEHFFSGVPTEEDDYLRKAMVSLWVNFATYGNPTPTEEDVELPRWNPVGSFPYNYLRIGRYNQPENVTRISMEKGLYDERLLLWRKIMCALKFTHECTCEVNIE
ncbi:hypothetical protein DMENIID0001_167890 [Sergentomyia squamirostris]